MGDLERVGDTSAADLFGRVSRRWSSRTVRQLLLRRMRR